MRMSPISHFFLSGEDKCPNFFFSFSLNTEEHVLQFTGNLCITTDLIFVCFFQTAVQPVKFSRNLIKHWTCPVLDALTHHRVPHLWVRAIPLKDMGGGPGPPLGSYWIYGHFQHVYRHFLKEQLSRQQHHFRRLCPCRTRKAVCSDESGLWVTIRKI